MMIFVKRMFQKESRKSLQCILCLILGLPFSTLASAQELELALGGPAQPAAPGRLEAPIDLTGTWVSLVTAC
jgi:hypothetical protein